MLPEARSAVLYVLRGGKGYAVNLEIPTEGPSVLAGTASVSAADRLDVLTALEWDLFAGQPGASKPFDPDALLSIGRLMYGLFLPLSIQERLRVWDGPLTIATDDPAIPWELLHDGRGFLGLQHAVGRRLITGRTAPRRLTQQPESPTFLFVADPEGDLPGAAAEAHYLVETLSRRGFACDLILGGRATYLNVQEALQSGRYQVIHYAGHADFDSQRPEESGLRLTQGRTLPAGQIERVLRGSPLVFLNACSSGREGLQDATALTAVHGGAMAEGLAGAFILGGAQGFIGSLWPVQDEGSRDFAACFYTRLLSGESVGEALRLAREHLLRTRPEHAVWAAFVLYGDPAYRWHEARHPKGWPSEPEAGEPRESRPLPVREAQPATMQRTSSTVVHTTSRVDSARPRRMPQSVAQRLAHPPEGGRLEDSRAWLGAAAASLVILVMIGLLVAAGWWAFGRMSGPVDRPPTPVATLQMLSSETAAVLASASSMVPPTTPPTPSATPLRPVMAGPAQPTAAPKPTATPALGGHIAFVAPQESGDTIYVMRADGTDLRPLTPGADPTWSPDGSRLAFAALPKGGIWVISADGSSLGRLTATADWQPTWSPDGKRIAFMSHRDGNREIYVMNADGSGQWSISNNPWDDRHPSWSPAGDQIAFISNRSGRWQIWVMASDGGEQVALTADDNDHFRPVWSPDGGQIAYGVWDRARKRNQIWVMNADGSGQRLLTDHAVYRQEYRGYGLAWAPLDRISFVSDRAGRPQIYLMNPDGTGQRAVTGMPAGSWSPSWALRMETNDE